jgi:hypothetical protein
MQSFPINHGSFSGVSGLQVCRRSAPKPSPESRLSNVGDVTSPSPYMPQHTYTQNMNMYQNVSGTRITFSFSNTTLYANNFCFSKLLAIQVGRDLTSQIYRINRRDAYQEVLTLK